MIGIITPGNIKYTPYVENYINIIKKSSEPYKVMSWDKKDICEEGIDLRFRFPTEDSDRKRMLLGYIRFIKECKQFIKINNIDKLIIMTAAPAFFLGYRFLSKYRNKFILDIRDDSPFIRRFPNQFKRLCSLATNVVVSSNEFSPWTGRDTILCHNMNLEQLKLHMNDSIDDNVNEPIRIVFAGMMNEANCNIDVLTRIGNDQRFSLVYIGGENYEKKRIEEFVETEGLKNVSFEGTYDKKEIISIYREKADIINIFREQSVVNRNALPNKLYEAVLSGKPIAVYEHNVAIASYAQKYSLGFIIPESAKVMINDYLYQQMHNFDHRKYVTGRKAFLVEVENDMKQFTDVLEAFCNK